MFFFFTGRNPDQLRGALPCDVTTGGVPLDDAKDQTHGRAVGRCHPLARCQAEPEQAPEEEGERTLCSGETEGWDVQGWSACCVSGVTLVTFCSKIYTFQMTALLYLVYFVLCRCTRVNFNIDLYFDNNPNNKIKPFILTVSLSSICFKWMHFWLNILSSGRRIKFPSLFICLVNNSHSSPIIMSLHGDAKQMVPRNKKRSPFPPIFYSTYLFCFSLLKFNIFSWWLITEYFSLFRILTKPILCFMP